MSKYNQQKETARQKCIDIVNENSEKQLYWSEVYEQNLMFNKIAKRFGLIKEFRENALI